MEIKFKDKLQYQTDAVDSVIRLFEGQPKIPSEISITSRKLVSPIKGTGNLFEISIPEIKDNFFQIQEDNGLVVNDDLESLDFTVEMETGTGKTYVYLRTILELNKQYGFSKFVIVVPSVAIREGVKKTIDITRKHFSQLYKNPSYTDFVFNSDKMSELKNFMEDDNIQIMIITIQSFNRESNKIRQECENGVIPFNYITKTNPIVIIDEPQSTSSTPKQKEAIADLNPLFTLQYSATPKDTTNLIYRLNAVDAYNKHLVKKIEVDSFDAADYQGKPYVHLNEVKQNKQGVRSANITFVKKSDTGLNTANQNVKIGDDLSVKKLSNNSSYDDGYVVEDISVREGEERIIFENGNAVYLNQSINDINQEGIRKAQIEATIREHLKKERKYAKKNIKVLSLFFIDKVENYRFYDEEGSHKGKYARWFEEYYNKIIKEDGFSDLPKYILDMAPEEVHDGYFSIDKKKWTNTSGETTKDDSTYEKIMKDKEKLLNPKDNLRFIFSHSALKEGWDNPNVFQICTFIETQSDLSKRQKIGRGLRLCVDGDGNRVDESYGDEFEDINRLTVLANESFENFSKSLQKEMINDGIEFNYVKIEDFINIPFMDKNGNDKTTERYHAELIWGQLFNDGLILKDGHLTKKWDKAIKENKVILPKKVLDTIEPQMQGSFKLSIIDKVNSKSAKNYIKNKKDRITVTLDKDKIESSEFNNLWDKIKYQSTYSVKLNTEILIEECVEDMGLELKHIQKPKIHHVTGDIEINKDGVKGITRTDRQKFIDVESNEIPNIVKDLHDATHLTKATIIEILLRSNSRNDTFEKLLINPTEFYNITVDIIKRNLNQVIIKNIEYEKIDGQNYDSTDFKPSFDEWVKDNDFAASKLVKATKSVYDYVKCDSNFEFEFAQDLEEKEDIEFFIKLPNWFKIKTPGGYYNPDWALTTNIDGKKETYFVIETKGTSHVDQLPEPQANKVKCGFKHFELIEELTYDVCVDYKEFSERYLIE
ncbi:DEAD/DEAH box helicase family protein [Methanobrevibacter sp.]|uniref:restriction endonuclease n=1 Tax=Methanobrevibacter sp. TaxID=66852 RepID=UPI003867AFCE